VLALRGTGADGRSGVLASFGAPVAPFGVESPFAPLVVVVDELVDIDFPFQHPGNACSGTAPATITPALNAARRIRFSFMTYLRLVFRRLGRSNEPSRS
jgi:hypothetical protein